MEIRQIYYALETAKCRSFSKAAKNLYITQPAITHQIKALEEELQVRLFERTTHGIKLTPDGEKFCEYGERIIHAVDDLRTAFDVGGPDYQPLLQIGVFPFYSSSPLQHMLTAFFANNYKVVGKLRTTDNYQAFEMLQNGELDFAIVKTRKENIPPTVSYRILDQENLYVLIQRDKMDSEDGTIPLSRLGEFPLLTGDDDSHFYQEMQEMYEKNNIPFRVPFMNTKETHIIAEMVEEGVGIALATDQTANRLESDVVAALRIEPEQKFCTIVAYPKKKHPRGIYLTFLNYLEDEYRKLTKKGNSNEE
ncbi:MAG: LysR family transcriptional regulator [Eubacteriales bacterium]|nr:LysR family transcriptional regulator [Eubacteriales bacterium]